METEHGSSKWANLLTEQSNPGSERIDELSPLEIVRLMNEEDRGVAEAVSTVLEDVAAVVDLVVASFRRGGRLFYVGAGTSGRLGVLDAAECPPTFGTDPSLVQGLIAGGPEALVRSREGAEDRFEEGGATLEERGASRNDVVVGIAASGITPFVVGALSWGREKGASTIFLTCSPETAKAVETDVTIVLPVGPEVISGSTRLKAGTATKLVLNMLTTAAMVRIGKVYGNMMVDLTPSSKKLRDRAVRILSHVSGLTHGESRQALIAAGHDLKAAIIVTKRVVSLETARRLLARHGGIVKKALADTDVD